MTDTYISSEYPASNPFVFLLPFLEALAPAALQTVPPLRTLEAVILDTIRISF